MKNLLAIALATVFAGALAAEEEASGAARIDGRVLAGTGVPVEHVKVQAAGHGTAAYSDHHGRFEIAGCVRPCLLTFTHPRFVEHSVEVSGSESPLEVSLQAKQEVFERIDVTAERGSGDRFTAVSVASTVIQPEEKAVAASTLTELVEGAPGVSENGQGGLFQVFAIRGVSRHRVLTLVSGMPITGERRAGASTSFIDPLLIGSVDVLRGPSSTWYGSGALGGVVQVFPQTWDGLHFETGWNSFGDESYQHVAWGDPETGWSVGFARRDVDNDEGADGLEYDGRYTQYSAAIRKSWQVADTRYEILAVPTLGRDIGKPNTDFPERATTYPQETHVLLKFAMSSPKLGKLSAFVHPNNLVTEVVEDGESFNEVRNESLELGLNWQREWTSARRATVSGRYGVDYVGRRAVDADERDVDLVDGSVREALTLDGATQDEVAAYGGVRWSWGGATLQAGSRLTWQQQTNGGAPSRDDTAWTSFLGLVQPLRGGFELTANVGSGLRFPNLSERFFTGTSGRGQVIGNPDLDPERSLNVDLGVRWYGDKAFLSAQVFELRIDDYVERIDTPDDVRTFVNLTSGAIRGVELEGFYQISERWLLSWSGHLLDGEADDGAPLADVSPDRLQAGLQYRRGPWLGRLMLQHRARKDDPGSGEVEIPAADLVAASLSYRLAPDLALTVHGRNLLDEEYLNSADDKTSVAPGRSVGLGLSWSSR